jgi:ABC-type uncharacterized transport system ATPase subunit
MTRPPRLILTGIGKRFPGVVANDGVNLTVGAGEIHALVGENGAGKSTLVKIIDGVLQADEGTIVWEGRAVRIPDPKAARALGIGMVFQHFSLFDSMTVAENVALGLDGSIGMARLSREIRGREPLLRFAPRSWARGGTPSPSASVSASRSSAACFRSRSSSSWTSRPRC